MKVQDLLALVGGVLKAVFTFFQLISYFFNNFHLTEYILDKLKESSIEKEIKIKSIKENAVDMNKSNNKLSVKDNVKNDSGISNIIENNFIHDKIKKFKGDKANSLDNFDIQKLDYLRYFICKSKETKGFNLFKMADKTRSIEKMIEVYQEIINLKSMLLSEDQLLAFKFLKNIKEKEIPEQNEREKVRRYLFEKKNSPGLYDIFLIENNKLICT